MTGFFFIYKEKDKKKKQIKKQSFPALLLKICHDFQVFKLNWSTHLEAFNFHNLIFKSPF